jgi:hypothetical protein
MINKTFMSTLANNLNQNDMTNISNTSASKKKTIIFVMAAIAIVSALLVVFVL